MPYFPRTLNPGPDEGDPTYRMSMLPFGTYAGPDGSEHLGFAIPGMISGPVNALARLMGSPSHPGSFAQGPDNPAAAEDMRTLLETFLGGSATRGMGAVEKGAMAAPDIGISRTVSAHRPTADVPPMRFYRGKQDQNLFPGNSDALFMSDSPDVAGTYANINLDGSLIFPQQETGAVAPIDAYFANPMIHDAGGSSWANIPFGSSTTSTKELADYARNAGHDGLIINNLIDDSGERVPSAIGAALQKGTLRSPLTGETLFSDQLPSLPGAVIAGAEHPTLMDRAQAIYRTARYPFESSVYEGPFPEVPSAGNSVSVPANTGGKAGFDYIRGKFTVSPQNDMEALGLGDPNSGYLNALMRNAGPDHLSVVPPAPPPHLSDFVQKGLAQQPGSSVTRDAAYESYRRWADQNGLNPTDIGLFAQGMTDHGLVTQRIAGAPRYVGVDALYSDGLPSLWSSSLHLQQDQRYPNALFTY